MGQGYSYLQFKLLGIRVVTRVGLGLRNCNGLTRTRLLRQKERGPKKMGLGLGLGLGGFRGRIRVRDQGAVRGEVGIGVRIRIRIRMVDAESQHAKNARHGSPGHHPDETSLLSGYTRVRVRYVPLLLLGLGLGIGLGLRMGSGLSL